MPENVTAFLALGSNLGDRLANLQRAVDLLAGIQGIEIVRSSRIYETEPVGPAQPEYLNGALEIRTSLAPGQLLAACLGVEDAMGRVRLERWGPRIVDVDVLTYGDEDVDEPDLTIPHPRMHERAFVLVPLLELTADPHLPGGRHVADLRLGTAVMTDVRPFAPPLRVH